MTDYSRVIHHFKDRTVVEGEKYEPGWYFSDEAYYYHGPMKTREDAIRAFHIYVEGLNRDRPRASSEADPAGDGGAEGCN